MQSDQFTVRCTQYEHGTTRSSSPTRPRGRWRGSLWIWEALEVPLVVEVLKVACRGQSGLVHLNLHGPGLTSRYQLKAEDWASNPI